MVVNEGGYLAALKIFGKEMIPLPKSIYYFVFAILVVVIIVKENHKQELSCKKKKRCIGALLFFG
jgi:hypothetical protein